MLQWRVCAHYLLHGVGPDSDHDDDDDEEVDDDDPFALTDYVERMEDSDSEFSEHDTRGKDIGASCSARSALCGALSPGCNRLWRSASAFQHAFDAH